MSEKKFVPGEFVPGERVRISDTSLDMVDRLDKTRVLEKITEDSYSHINAATLYDRFSGPDLDYKRAEVRRFVEEKLTAANREHQRQVGQLLKDIPSSIWGTLPQPVLKHIYRSLIRSYLLNTLAGSNSPGVHRVELGEIAISSVMSNLALRAKEGGVSHEAHTQLLALVSAEDQENVNEEEWQRMKSQFESMSI